MIIYSTDSVPSPSVFNSVSFRSVLIESDNTCSFHHGNKFLNPVFQYARYSE